LESHVVNPRYTQEKYPREGFKLARMVLVPAGAFASKTLRTKALQNHDRSSLPLFLIELYRYGSRTGIPSRSASNPSRLPSKSASLSCCLTVIAPRVRLHRRHAIATIHELNNLHDKS
jgi:hypothetical protein